MEDTFREKELEQPELLPQNEWKPTASESIRVTTCDSKPQRADDVALTQCILCIVTVLCVLGLHWVNPEWQAWLLEQYTTKRNALPVQWLDAFLQAVRQWILQ